MNPLASSRTTRATTWPGCSAAARGPSASSPPRGSAWCRPGRPAGGAPRPGLGQRGGGGVAGPAGAALLHAVELILEAGLAVVGRHLGAPSRSPAPAPCWWRWRGSAAGLADELASPWTDWVTRCCPAPWPTNRRHRPVVALAGGALGGGGGARSRAQGRRHAPRDRAGRLRGAGRGAVAGVAPGSTTLVFGHLADGNLHVNMVGPPAEDAGPSTPSSTSCWSSAAA